MSHKGRLLIILLLTSSFAILLGWTAFHPNRTSGLWSNPLIVGIILILGIVPIYPLCRQLRKRPPLSALALLLLIGAIASALVFYVADLVLHLNAPWISAVSDLSTGLIVASCLLGIWNGFMRR